MGISSRLSEPAREEIARVGRGVFLTQGGVAWWTGLGLSCGILEPFTMPSIACCLPRSKHPGGVFGLESQPTTDNQHYVTKQTIECHLFYLDC